MWKNDVEPDRPQTIIWCMRFACWITKAAGTHSVHVIGIAFSLQQWLHDAPQYNVIRKWTVLFSSVNTEPESCNVRSKAVLVLKHNLTGG